VGKGGQGKAAVCEPHLLSIFAQNLVRCLNHHALVFGHGLPARFFNAVLDDELVNLGHIDTVTDVSDPQPWNLRAEAIWRC
jgi:hypothetical protein